MGSNATVSTATTSDLAMLQQDPLGCPEYRPREQGHVIGDVMRNWRLAGTVISLSGGARKPGEMARWAVEAPRGARWVAATSHTRFVRAFSGGGTTTPHPDRKALLDCKRVVLKVGTAVVSNPNGTLVRRVSIPVLMCSPRGVVGAVW